VSSRTRCSDVVSSKREDENGDSFTHPPPQHRHRYLQESTFVPYVDAHDFAAWATDEGCKHSIIYPRQIHVIYCRVTGICCFGIYYRSWYFNTMYC